MEGGRGNHSGCMFVVGIGYGGLGGGRNGGGGCYACGTKPGSVWSHVGRCQGTQCKTNIVGCASQMHQLLLLLCSDPAR